MALAGLAVSCSAQGTLTVDLPAESVTGVRPLEPFGYVSVRTRAPVDSIEGLREVGDPLNGWRAFMPDPPFIFPSEFERLAVDLAHTVGAPVVVASSQDSDWAYLAIATPDGRIARAVIFPGRAHGYEEGLEALHLLKQQPGDPAQAIVDVWRAATGDAVSLDEVRDAMTSHGPYAEFPLQDVMELLGVPYRARLIG